MTDLATLQARLETLKNARGSGALTVSYQGKSVTYRSDRELLAAIGSLQAEIDAAQGVARVRNVAVRSTGWHGVNFE